MGWLEGGTAVFAFRGTASRQDGLQDVKILSRNIDYLQELYPGVKAHLGVCLPQTLLDNTCCGASYGCVACKLHHNLLVCKLDKQPHLGAVLINQLAAMRSRSPVVILCRICHEIL